MQMGIEQKTSTKKGKVYSESKKNRRRRQKKMSILQRLYQICKDVFDDSDPAAAAAAAAAAVPSSDKIERLKSFLDNMTEEDVGLMPDLPFFRDRTEHPPIISYLRIYEGDKFSIGIFCMPSSAVIPLHNHPQMTVFSKLLFGTMHIKSYDWVHADSTDDAAALTSSPSQSDGNGTEIPPPSGGRLAKVKVNSNFTAPCETSILYPTDGGNMHCFTAMTPCAVLDVLGPPYRDYDGRHCQYYFDTPVVDSSGDGREKEEVYAWLKEREKPEDLIIIGYNGENIVPN